MDVEPPQEMCDDYEANGYITNTPIKCGGTPQKIMYGLIRSVVTKDRETLRNDMLHVVRRCRLLTSSKLKKDLYQKLTLEKT